MVIEHDTAAAVIGAGVVGLAVGAELARAGWSVLIVEQHGGPGRETSSRNSEVIHAGLYYPPGSLKARLCVRGNALLYELCRRDSVEHRRLGKLVVATTAAEQLELHRLAARGQQNGVPELRVLDRSELARLEPAVAGMAALHSGSSGIIDAHGLVKALEARTRASGGQIAYGRQVVGIEPLRDGADGYRVRMSHRGGEEQLLCRWLVNSAGLAADRVAALAGVRDYRLHWCRGDYFAVTGAHARVVQRLIYPVPAQPLQALGVHLTPDLGGRLRIGPDAFYIQRHDMPGNVSGDVIPGDVDASKAEAFASAAQRLVPALPAGSLRPDTFGIRPKLQGMGDPWRDFIICEERGRGRPHLVDLLGIESPGLTAALAIGEHVHELMRELGG